MPVGFFTFHAYRSWTEDNPKGFVQRGKPGIQPPNKRLAKHRASIAKSPPIRFDVAQKRLLIESARTICSDLDVRLYGITATPTHIHLMVGWCDARSPSSLTTPLKQKLGRDLSAQRGTKGNRWFSRGCDEELISDRGHFDYLLAEYLPKHLDESGVMWREGDA